MKSYLFSIFLILFSLNSIFSQNKVDAKGMKQGAWVKYYTDSNIPIYKGNFKDDHPVGEFRYYYPSGNVKAILQNESLHKCYAWYYFENQKVMSHGLYIDMKKDSIWENYNNQGLLISKESYKDNVLNGLKNTFYIESQIESGELQLFSTETYKDSLLNGSYQLFFSTGIVREKGTYVLGKRIGTKETFHTNGAKAGYSKYKEDKLHGYTFAFDEEGNEIDKNFYLKGERLTGEDLKKYLDYCTKKGINPDE